MFRKLIVPFVWAFCWLRFGRWKPERKYLVVDNSDLNELLRKATRRES